MNKEKKTKKPGKEQVDTPLAKEIMNRHQIMCNAIGLLKEADTGKKLIDFSGNMVSVRDIIAYQIGWGRLLASWYKQGLTNSKFEMPGEGFVTWDYQGLAKKFFGSYQFKDLRKQLCSFSDIAKEIADIARVEEEKGRLNTIGVWGWCTLSSGKKWPLCKWINVNTVAPYKRATQLIRKFAKALSKKHDRQD